MKTIRIETVALLLEYHDLDSAREWCRTNKVELHKKGVIEFLILDEFKNVFENKMNVKLKTDNYENT